MFFTGGAPLALKLKTLPVEGATAPPLPKRPPVFGWFEFFP